MSDILIRMEMPKHCLECPLRAFDGYDYHCPFTGIDSLSIGRQDDCPLHELPPHGDLIDRYRIPYRDTYGGLIAEKDVIDRLPTIVSAEKGETQ